MDIVSPKPKAVCLLSGGLDSATALYCAIRDGFQPLALTIHYGQIHERELISAKRIAEFARAEHQVVSIELPWKGSALLDSSVAIPENHSSQSVSDKIPSTYVPARNTIFLSLAASYAEAAGAQAIYIGANAIDYSGYPDCRPEYLEQFKAVIARGTKAGVEGRKIEICAPLISMTKADIIKLAGELKVPLKWTWSCYRGLEKPCGNCDSCFFRAKGFEEAGIADPALERISNCKESLV